METAVRNYLGYARAGELEGEFLAVVAAVSKVAKGRNPRDDGRTHAEADPQPDPGGR